MRSPEILIIGQSGQIARALGEAPWWPEARLTLASRHEIDLSDPQSIREKVGARHWSLIINCGAYTQVDKAEDEPQLTFAVNAEGPTILAEAARRQSSPLILSTCKPALIEQSVGGILRKTAYPNFEIIVGVDEANYGITERRQCLQALRTDSRLQIYVYDKQKFNFARANNITARQASGTLLCFFNDDVEVITSDWLTHLVARIEIPDVGAVGPLLLYPDGRIQHAGIILGLGGVAGHPFTKLAKTQAGYFGRAVLEQDFSAITAACLLIRRDAFDSLEGFNEKFAIAFNDVDLCIRLRRAGWRIVWTPAVELIHHESTSLGPHDSANRAPQFAAEVSLMQELWGDTLLMDPCYNPNLSLNSNYFDLAFPPRIQKLPRIEGSVRQIA